MGSGQRPLATASVGRVEMQCSHWAAARGDAHTRGSGWEKPLTCAGVEARKADITLRLAQNERPPPAFRSTPTRPADILAAPQLATGPAGTPRRTVAARTQVAPRPISLTPPSHSLGRFSGENGENTRRHASLLSSCLLLVLFVFTSSARSPKTGPAPPLFSTPFRALLLTSLHSTRRPLHHSLGRRAQLTSRHECRDDPRPARHSGGTSVSALLLDGSHPSSRSRSSLFTLLLVHRVYMRLAEQ